MRMADLTRGGFGPTTLAGFVFLWLTCTAWPAAFAAEEGGFFDTISRIFGADTEPEPDTSRMTTDQVFQFTQDVILEIEILREELGVSDFVVEAELVEDRSPIHAYAKTLELQAKVIKMQRRFGAPLALPTEIPFKEIHPGDVAASLQGILRELRAVKAEMVIDRLIRPTPLVAGKSSSLVYQSLTEASAMLDGLVGAPLAPDDVYHNCLFILEELRLVAEEFGVSLEQNPPVVEGAKNPTEVAQQLQRATYKVIALQTRLGMDASGVPGLTLVRVSPSENYDATSMLLAEMARLKFHLDIDERGRREAGPGGRSPADVFALVLLIIQNLDRVAAAV